MTGDDIARLIYLVLLGVAVGGYFVAQGRGRMGRTAQQAAVWGLIFVGAIAAVGLWGDIRRETLDLPRVAGDSIEIPRAGDGHFHLPLLVNGKTVRFMIDTGASNVVLTRRDARRAGIDTDDLRFAGQASTANGMVRTARIRLETVRLGAIEDRRVPAYVNDGDMVMSLLGMDYLNRFSEMTIRGDVMVLTR